MVIFYSICMKRGYKVSGFFLFISSITDNAFHCVIDACITVISIYNNNDCFLCIFVCMYFEMVFFICKQGNCLNFDVVISII